MTKKIRIAFIKFAGCASGGTERYIQTIAANLPKDKFEVDYFYTNAALYVGSDYRHADNEQSRIDYLKNSGVNLINVYVGAKDVSKYNHPWIGTNLQDLFDEKNYDIIQTGRAGHPEFPFTEIKNTPIVDAITLPGMIDHQSNIVRSVHLSNFQKDTWIQAGGNASIVEVIPLFSEKISRTNRYLRDKLNIKDSDFVFGFHQRPDDGIYFPASLMAYKEIMNENTHFVIMGGSKQYSQTANELGLVNFHQLEAAGDDKSRDEFLNTLNVFAHSRKDGETFGLAIAEAMSYGIPILSHYAPANGHVETIGDGGFVCSNVSEYSEYMKKLMVDSGFYKQLSTNASKRYIDVLSLEANMKKFITIYESIMEQKKIHDMNADDFWNEQYK